MALGAADKGGANKQPAKRTQHWHRLDNTANLFPVITTKRETNVFRLAINLDEPVIPELLQQALERVLPWFDAFRVRLRRGMFWHYLDENPGVPQVHEEDDYPCKRIEPAQNEQFLFHVSYYACRVNLEVFHVLTDGTAGMRFLQAICCQYLMLAHPAEFGPEEKARHWMAEHATDTEDGYVQSYSPSPKASYKVGRAYRIRGERSFLDNLSVIQAQTPVPELLALCRGKGVSVTQYLTAQIAYAVYTQQLSKRPVHHPVNILVPVDLRKMFDSNTALNFFSSIYVSLRMDQPGLTFDTVLAEVKSQFEEKLNPDAMLEKISYTVGSGYSPFVRAVPLPLKNLALRIIFKQSAKGSTLGFSNVGSVKMPAPFEKYVTGAHALLSTVPREPFKCTICSCKGVFTLSFTSTLRSVELQRAVIRSLAADGLGITVESNGVDYESL